MKHYRILIVGGRAGRPGPVQGAAPDRIRPGGDRTSGQLGDAGTGMYLPANGVRALRALGLEQAVAARAAEIPRQRLLDHRGRRLADIDLHQLWGDLGPCLALPRSELHQVLRDGVPVRSVSPSTMATAASSTWSSALTGSTPPSGGSPSTGARRSRSASTAGGS